MTVARKPLALLILDGWGYRAPSADNAITNAHTPNLDRLFAERPSTLISGSGLDVGLPDGQMGNSEVGHINLGAGRVVYQELTRITKAIADGEFNHNPALAKAVDEAVEKGHAVHIMGLLSPGGVHSHEDHIEAMIRMAAERGAERIYLHAFLDGRDTPPRSAEASLARFQALFAELGKGAIASVVGRYYAMDRDQRWDRVEKAYRLITEAEGSHRADDAVSALKAAYQRDENDEFVAPTAIGQGAPLADGDSLIFMNFRADRARQITRAFVQDDFDGFQRAVRPTLTALVMLTQYAADIDTPCAFPPEALVNTFGELMAKAGRQQLRISETEKYAHVTFFFNGGVETPFEGEERILIDSPKVATYDLQPQMSSEALTDQLVAAIESGQFDTIICNYPNGDMVGHTGNYDAAVLACEAVDRSIGRVVEALERVGGEALITADHGNAEQMTDLNTGQAHTAHTSEPVPFIYIGRDAEPRSGGALSDVAPTMLYLMGMPIPQEMTGRPLLTLKASAQS
ncbi:2,3-bisphosphoglycerate-independent phosphoglycerate mutase [Ferrimonas balearica]|uniref:2,3-bisphosphoglycerate-independent phosphoglycerate mutase n=1 Tax=Ferrimonas balearica TaxID=44012 RepID=UPI001C99EA7C|nr:2,3-bisphosphoglycerate-independent phosphoglycerate mutase [Ferrimonas balearica]MBY5993396.1 2,3-bisphosphoglycerate-independent phosphoglycerate mutase [Ferrimonas balearica]